ncbi:uracil phosphoribosyltransferase homolog isoform X2 [Centruroides sculpturatus]|uniref:uracil phosphoribosyltransferase homolog isoform X2 n=1 Tax=Centruroides sculpturatus TaxID=218467 RepID=UPI000C6CD951|nr:uracil phosphoribosyltransferase homolog isoform X2 [Centruroides sculpturatus]
MEILMNGTPDVVKSLPIKSAPTKTEDYGPNFKVIPINDQIRELQTVIRDKNTSRSDFVFYADRLIRLVVEEGLNQLPYTPCIITTPTDLELLF